MYVPKGIENVFLRSVSSVYQTQHLRVQHGHAPKTDADADTDTDRHGRGRGRGLRHGNRRGLRHGHGWTRTQKQTRTRTRTRMRLRSERRLQGRFSLPWISGFPGADMRPSEGTPVSRIPVRCCGALPGTTWDPGPSSHGSRPLRRLPPLACTWRMGPRVSLTPVF